MPKKNNNIKKIKKNKNKVLCILIDSYSYMRKKKRDKVFYAFAYKSHLKNQKIWFWCINLCFPYSKK